MFSSALNNQLRGLMNKLGFDVVRTEGLNSRGLFNPMNGIETSEKLRAVI